MTIRILLADDHQLVRAGVRLILEGEEDFVVVGEASDGEDAVFASDRLRPDVVLMDVQMPKLNGLEATRRIAHGAECNSRVLILTTFEQDEYLFEALRAGASGFLLKNTPPEDLVQAVRVVAAGDALLSPSVTRRVIEEYAQRPATVETDHAVQLLTERERDVLRQLATGKSNAELPDHLYLSESTVKTHVSHLLASWDCEIECKQSCLRTRAADSARRPEALKSGTSGVGIAARQRRGSAASQMSHNTLECCRASRPTGASSGTTALSCHQPIYAATATAERRRASARDMPVL